MAEIVNVQSAESSSQPSKTEKPLTYSEKQWQNAKKNSPLSRRRARNERLRKMLSPKNALMALNELLKDDGNDFAYFQVDQCMKPNEPSSYCATLTTGILDYSVVGFAESKSKAKNIAAEEALKAIYLDRLKKVSKMELEWVAKKEKRQKEWEERQKERKELQKVREERQKEREQKKQDGIPCDDEEDDMESPEKDTSESQEDEEKESERVYLPMVQLTSFALHKLFTSWESEGCVVPNFYSGESKLVNPKANKKEKLKAKKAVKRRQLPVNAASLHPGFLLYYMNPGIEYKNEAIDAQTTDTTKPTKPTFAVSVKVDEKTYGGKANSKKEARRLAALAACEDLYQVKFDVNSVSNHPVWAEDNDDDNSLKKAKLPEAME